MRSSVKLVSRTLSLVLIAVIRGYQLAISPLLGPKCKFYPSCSNYAIGSLDTHGPVKGLILTAVRVCRCHPWQLGGLDPVPPLQSWRPTIYPDGRPRVPSVDLHRYSNELGV